MYKLVKVCDDGFLLDVNDLEGNKIRFATAFEAQSWLFRNIMEYWYYPHLYYTEFEETNN